MYYFYYIKSNNMNNSGYMDDTYGVKTTTGLDNG